MAKVVKIHHVCKHCDKKLHPSSDTYYKCDHCGGIVCNTCFKPHEGKDLCQHCQHVATNRILGFPAGTVKVAAFVIALVVLAIFFTWFSRSASITGYTLIGNYQDAKADATLDLFVMSKCPYGVQAENTIMPIIEKFEGKVMLNLYFIARESGGKFTSLHGQTEVDENMRQLTIIKLYPEKFFTYLKCFNADYSNAEGSFEKCAKEAGIDADAVKTFAASDEGKQLFIDNIKKGNGLNVGGSPTIYLNDEPYESARSESAITKALCTYAAGAAPCKDVAAEPEVTVKVVNDEKCSICDATSLIEQLKTVVPSLKVQTISYTSAEGKKLLSDFSAETVPMVVFDSASIEKSSGYETLQRYLVKQGDNSMLRVSGVKMINREEQPKVVKLFLMSQCPYGTMAQENLKEVVSAMPDLKYEIYFIAKSTETGFDSLHGAAEVAEDINQVCILKYAPEKYLDYTAAYKNEYDACAAKAQVDQNYTAYSECLAGIDSYKAMDSVGIKSGQIMICAKSQEGQDLLTANIALGNELGISASPTFLFNNNIQGSGSTPEMLKQSICKLNTGIAGCEKTLSDDAAQAASAGQC